MTFIAKKKKKNCIVVEPVINVIEYSYYHHLIKLRSTNCRNIGHHENCETYG